MLTSWKKEKKAKNLMQNLAKKMGFKFASELIGFLFYFLPFYVWKHVLADWFARNITRSGFWCKPQKSVFCIKFLSFSSFLSFLAQKTLKKYVLTSVCSAQHPNTGRNIQHTNNFKWHTIFILSILTLLLCRMVKNLFSTTKLLNHCRSVFGFNQTHSESPAVVGFSPESSPDKSSQGNIWFHA